MKKDFTVLFRSAVIAAIGVTLVTRGNAQANDEAKLIALDLRIDSIFQISGFLDYENNVFDESLVPLYLGQFTKDAMIYDFYNPERNSDGNIIYPAHGKIRSPLEVVSLVRSEYGSGLNSKKLNLQVDYTEFQMNRVRIVARQNLSGESKRFGKMRIETEPVYKLEYLEKRGVWLITSIESLNTVFYCDSCIERIAIVVADDTVPAVESKGVIELEAYGGISFLNLGQLNISSESFTQTMGYENTKMNSTNLDLTTKPGIFCGLGIGYLRGGEKLRIGPFAGLRFSTGLTQIKIDTCLVTYQTQLGIETPSDAVYASDDDRLVRFTQISEEMKYTIVQCPVGMRLALGLNDTWTLYGSLQINLGLSMNQRFNAEAQGDYEATTHIMNSEGQIYYAEYSESSGQDLNWYSSNALYDLGNNLERKAENKVKTALGVGFGGSIKLFKKLGGNQYFGLQLGADAFSWSQGNGNYEAGRSVWETHAALSQSIKDFSALAYTFGINYTIHLNNEQTK